MPNLIMGLKYHHPLEEANTEAELLEIFADLRKNYEKLSSQFRITKNNGELLKNFGRLLSLAVEKPINVLVSGSGDIGGLVIKDSPLEYDLSEIFEFSKYWNIGTGNNCSSCLNVTSRFVGMDTESYCISKNASLRDIKELNDKDYICPNHDAKKKNAQGKPTELIEEACVNKDS